MKILKILRKKWLSHRVYKYTLKYDNSLSERDYYYELSKNYYRSALYIEKEFNIADSNQIEYFKLSQEYKLKGDQLKNLANIYLSKKLNLEEELQYYSNFQNV